MSKKASLAMVDTAIKKWKKKSMEESLSTKQIILILEFLVDLKRINHELARESWKRT